MNPGKTVLDNVESGNSLLSLCCGVGFELRDATMGSLADIELTGVDIVPEYIEVFVQRFPHAKTVVSDVVKYITRLPDKSFDVISVIDGIEHLTKKDGLKLVKQMKRVVKKQILLFTPDGFIRNEPHSAWGIEIGNEHQVHKSGWTQDELEKLGFTLLESADDISQHGEPYKALMMSWTP